MTGPMVLVIHSGARHNYALPAAFAKAGMLEAFYTDICAGRGIGRFVETAQMLPLPSGVKSFVDRLAGRRPPPEVLARTVTDEIYAIRTQKARRIEDPGERRHALSELAVLRSDRLVERGLGGATHLFKVLGEGGDLSLLANERGVPVLADVIIALSTARIHWEEFEAFPDWGPPPPERPDARGEFGPPPNFFETTDVFVCPSPFVADDLVTNWGVPRAATRIVPYALSARWFEIEPQPITGQVLFAGTADRRKGIHYMAAGAKKLSGRSLHFRVAGSVHEEVRTHPNATALTFLGRVPRAEIQAEFAAADIFVLPTLAEGSATVIYEAMAAGLAIITTPAAGSVIRDGLDGLIVPERDPDALAEAIDRLMTDRPLRDRLAHAARLRAHGAFGFEAYGSALVDLVLATPSRVTVSTQTKKA